MGLILLFVRITRSSLDVKYKAPGFDIFQKSNENGFAHSFLHDILCLCFVKEDVSKRYEAFQAGYFPWTCKIRQMFRSC